MKPYVHRTFIIDPNCFHRHVIHTVLSADGNCCECTTEVIAHGLLPEIDNAARLLQSFHTSKVCRTAAVVHGEFCRRRIVSHMMIVDVDIIIRWYCWVLHHCRFKLKNSRLPVAGRVTEIVCSNTTKDRAGIPKLVSNTPTILPTPFTAQRISVCVHL